MILKFQQFNEELNIDDVDNIIMRVSKSGYLSKSNQDILSYIFSNNNFGDIIQERIDTINNFYQSFDPEYIEDILVEYFDGTGYDYTIQLGYYISTTKYQYSYSKIEDPEIIILDKDYFESPYKNTYLLTSVLKLLKKASDGLYKNNIKRIEDMKKRSSPMKYWEESELKKLLNKKTLDFCKQIGNKISQINPVFFINAKHKQTDEYYRVMYNILWDENEFQWNKSLDYVGITNLSREIGENGRLKKLGLIESKWTDSFKSSYVQEEVVNQFTIRLCFDI